MHWLAFDLCNVEWTTLTRSRSRRWSVSSALPAMYRHAAAINYILRKNQAIWIIVRNEPSEQLKTVIKVLFRLAYPFPKENTAIQSSYRCCLMKENTEQNKWYYCYFRNIGTVLKLQVLSGVFSTNCSFNNCIVSFFA